jgi:hypothetical protein
VTGGGRHGRAVADPLGFAREAAARGVFRRALGVVDGGLPPAWERTRAVWLCGEPSAEVGLELPRADAETAGFREVAW